MSMDYIDAHKLLEIPASHTHGIQPNEKYTFQQKGHGSPSAYGAAHSALTRVTPRETAESGGEEDANRSEHEKAASLLHDARLKLKEAAEINRRLQAENELLRREATPDGARTELDALRTDLQREKAEHHAATEEIEKLKKETHQIAKLKHHNEELTRKLEEASEKSNKQLQHLVKELQLENELLRKQVGEVQHALAREEEKSNQLLDQLSRAQRELENYPKVEKQVTVEREGMKARTDLLRKVYDTHRILVRSSRGLKDIRGSPTMTKLSNSTQLNYGRDITSRVDTMQEEINEAIQTSTFVIRTYFTTLEKLHCGMSSDWLRPDSGKPRALEERITTTTVLTASRSPSPNLSVSVGRVSPSLLPTYASASPTAAASSLVAAGPSPYTNSMSTTLSTGDGGKYKSPNTYRKRSPSPANLTGAGPRALNANHYPGTTREAMHPNHW